MACDYVDQKKLARNGKPLWICSKCGGKIAVDGQAPKSQICPTDEVDLVALRAQEDERRKAFEAQWPSMIEQAKNLGGALVRFASAPAEERFVSDEVFQQRIEICNGCPWKVTTKHGDRCKKCACYLSNVVGKARLKTEQCPIGKWPVTVEADGPTS